MPSSRSPPCLPRPVIGSSQGPDPEKSSRVSHFGAAVASELLVEGRRASLFSREDAPPRESKIGYPQRPTAEHLASDCYQSRRLFHRKRHHASQNRRTLTPSGSAFSQSSLRSSRRFSLLRQSNGQSYWQGKICSRRLEYDKTSSDKVQQRRLRPVQVACPAGNLAVLHRHHQDDLLEKSSSAASSRLRQHPSCRLVPYSEGTQTPILEESFPQGKEMRSSDSHSSASNSAASSSSDNGISSSTFSMLGARMPPRGLEVLHLEVSSQVPCRGDGIHRRERKRLCVGPLRALLLGTVQESLEHSHVESRTEVQGQVLRLAHLPAGAADSSLLPQRCRPLPTTELSSGENGPCDWARKRSSSSAHSLHGSETDRSRCCTANANAYCANQSRPSRHEVLAAHHSLRERYEEEKRRNPLLPPVVMVSEDGFSNVLSSSVLSTPLQLLQLSAARAAALRSARDPSVLISWQRRYKSVSAQCIAPPPSFSINFQSLQRCQDRLHRDCLLYSLFPNVDPLHLRVLRSDNNFVHLLDSALSEYSSAPTEEIELNTIPRSSDTSSFVYWKNGVRHHPPLAPKQPLLHLPFAPVTKPSFCWIALEMWFERLQPHSDLTKMVAWMSKDRALAHALGTPSYTVDAASYPRQTTTRSVSLDDLHNFRTQGTLVQHDGPNSISAVIFKVPKAGGKEARMIWDGRAFGDRLERHLDHLKRKDFAAGKLKSDDHYKIPETPLPLVPELVNKILEEKWKFISTIDAKNMFYQFSIRSAALRKYFGVELKTATQLLYFYLACLPQGISFAPSFAQHVSLYICRILHEEVTRRRRLDSLPPIDFFATAWIDNFILLTQSLSDREYVCKIFDELVSNSENVWNSGIPGLNLQMKAWEHQDSDDRLVVLGICFDLRHHRAFPASEKVQEAAELLERLTSSSSTTTFDPPTIRDYVRWFGLCQWMNYSTAEVPLCLYPAVMEKIRCICRTAQADDDWDAPVTVESALREEMIQITNVASYASRTYSPLPSQTSRIWSDASRQALAAFHDGIFELDSLVLHAFTVAYDSSKTSPSLPTTSSPASPFATAYSNNNNNNNTHKPLPRFNDVPMIILELYTGYMSFQLLPSADTWVSDNIPATRAYLRGHSGNKVCDRIVAQWISSGHCPSYVEWVDSHCMLADPLSRPYERVDFKPCGGKRHTVNMIRWKWSTSSS